MIKEPRVLEFLGILGLIGLVVFMLNLVVTMTGATEINILLFYATVVVIAVGAVAGIGILVVNRVEIRQNLILEQLDEVKRGQTELAAKVASMPELPQA
ncbi:MAG TPA: hypothetical protein PKD84_04815 [Propionicimonas sp.]|nr:hypothetical protein [Propionicimonas sp.]